MTIETTNPVVATTSMPDSYFSFTLGFEDKDEIEIYNSLDETSCSAIVYTLAIERSPFFFMIFYIVPSVIFVIISYCSFWINHESVTARTSVGITTVLISIGFYGSLNVSLPPIN